MNALAPAKRCPQWAEVAVVISSPDDENRCGSSLVQAGAFLYPSVDGGDKHRGAT